MSLFKLNIEIRERDWGESSHRGAEHAMHHIASRNAFCDPAVDSLSPVLREFCRTRDLYLQFVTKLFRHCSRRGPLRIYGHPIANVPTNDRSISESMCEL